MRMNKKGVSPIIATVLLIAIVIILSLIVFLWARGFVGEKAQKAGRAVELACTEVSFEARYVSQGGGVIDVINRGNIPIYGFDVKEIGEGEVLVHEKLGSTLAQGDTGEIELGGISGDEFLVVPVILAEGKEGRVEYPCPDQYGYAVSKP